LGRILPAHAGDTFGVFNVMIVLSAFGAIMTLALWLPAAANAPIIMYAIMYGLASWAPEVVLYMRFRLLVYLLEVPSEERYRTISMVDTLDSLFSRALHYCLGLFSLSSRGLSRSVLRLKSRSRCDIFHFNICCADHREGALGGHGFRFVNY
jgi:hypothetical protein